MHNVHTETRTRISLLGCDKPVGWKQAGNNIIMDLTNFGVNDMSCEHIRAFKIRHCQPAD